MTPLWPFSAALNSAVDPSLKDTKKSIQLLKLSQKSRVHFQLLTSLKTFDYITFPTNR